MKTDLISRKAIVDMLQDAEDETFADAERTMNPIKAIASGIVEGIKNHVIAAPAVDAVPVVRCKECKEYIYPAGVCKHWTRPVPCDGYCYLSAKMDGGASE